MEEVKLKMAKYIDKESFEEIVYDGMYHADYLNALSEFDKKAVDAVPVVRCKNCKRHEDEEPGMVYCPLQIGGWRSENWFCADGERRSE